MAKADNGCLKGCLILVVLLVVLFGLSMLALIFLGDRLISVLSEIGNSV